MRDKSTREYHSIYISRYFIKNLHLSYYKYKINYLLGNIFAIGSYGVISLFLTQKSHIQLSYSAIVVSGGERHFKWHDFIRHDSHITFESSSSNIRHL